MPMMELPIAAKGWNQYGNALVGMEATNTLHSASVFVTALGYLLGAASPGIVCMGSSDGTTAAMDGVNRLTSKTKIVCAAAGTAHSWIVLKWTATGMHALFDFNSATGAWLLSGTHSPNGLFSGGSVTTAPTATDSQLFKSSANSWIADNAQGRMNVLVWHSVDGKMTYVMIVCGLILVSTWFLGQPDQAQAGWTPPNITAMLGSTSLSNTRLMNTAIYTANSVFFGRNNSTNLALRCSFEGGGGTGNCIPVQAASVQYQPVSGCGGLCQPGLYSIAAPTGRHGALPDIWAGANVAPGTISQDPVYADRRIVTVGVWSLPWTLGETRFAT